MSLTRLYLPTGFGMKPWREYLNILFWLLIFLLAPRVLRWTDVTAAPLDTGVLSSILLAILAVLLFKATTWALIKSLWPIFANYSKDQFEYNFRTLLPWQKVLVYLTFYLFLLLCFVLCFASLF